MPAWADPIAAYPGGDSVLFASRRRTLITRGVRTVLTGDLSSVLYGCAPAAGAIAFDGSAHLIVPERMEWAGPLSRRRAVPPGPGGWRVRHVPDPDDYVAGVRLALDRLDRAELHKVVLARTLELSSDEPVNVVDLLRNLAAGAYTFSVPLPGAGRTLIGASPELLVAKDGRRVTANPLAGTAARSPDPIQDRRCAADLLASAKDRHEHQIVVDAVVEALRPFCAELQWPRTPSPVATATMWHLSTPVSGVLRDARVSSLALAAALHPTPAVCGTPTPLARRVIKEVEPFRRGFYTGFVGWTDGDGDGEWAVTIRCAEVEAQAIRLYAGAGIVPDSRPEDELAETGLKFRTMLNALGLSDLILSKPVSVH